MINLKSLCRFLLNIRRGMFKMAYIVRGLCDVADFKNEFVKLKQKFIERSVKPTDADRLGGM